MALFTGHTITPDSALGGIQIQRSLRFNSADSEYLVRTVTSEGNRVKWTWSGWVKKTRLGRTSYALLTSQNGGDGGGNNGIASIYFGSDDKIHVYYDTTGSNPSGAINDTVYRDTNSWYHIVWQVDAANSTSKIWVNGVEQSVGVQPISGYNYTMNQSGRRMTIGVDAWDLYTYSDTYIAETHFSDGQLYAASDFGYTDAQTGQWRPKNGNVIKSNITYGTNGFWLDFRDATSTTTLGYDYSGNGNHWTLTNMSVTDNYNVNFTSDTPTNNFCTMNNADNYNSVITNGGLEMTQASDPCRSRGTSIMPPNTGKYYYEMEVQAGASYIFGMKSLLRIGYHTSGDEGEICYYGYNGNKNIGQTDGSTVSSSYGASYSAGDTVAILYDSDAGDVYFYKNNTSQGLASTDINDKTYQPYVYLDNYGTTPVVHFNFGQRPFKYTPPTGARGLSSKDRATPVAAGIVRPQKHFDTLLWTGANTVNSRNITGLEFKPDWVWIKARNRSSYGGGLNYHHMVWDSVRGVGSTSSSSGKDLATNQAIAESSSTTYSNLYGHISSFNDGGFTVQKESGEPAIYTDYGSTNYVAWCWKAGGAAVSNSDGTITSSVSANTEAGFSIVSYTGNETNNATVGHGLGKSPDMVIIKDRVSNSAGNNWYVFHSGLASGHYVKLNQTSATAAVSGTSNGGVGSVTSTTFNFIQGTSGNNKNVNESGDTFIAYCFTSIPGYSKFGSYISNNSTDGPFINLGFKPAFVVFKGVTDAVDWVLYDNKRNTYNPTGSLLQPSNTAAEYSSSVNIDFVSNGVKIRSDSGYMNNPNNKKFIYMAFAERPSGSMFGLDANAR